VAGLKPTVAAVSTAGVLPVSRHLDHVGPLGRTVDDLAIVFGTIVDAHPLFLHEFNQLSAKSSAPNLHVVEEFFLERADAQTASVTRSALARLEIRGSARPAQTLPRSFGQVHAQHRRIMAVDAAGVHRRAYAERPGAFGPQLTALIEEGLAVSPVAYAAALEHQARFKKDVTALFLDGRIIVVPTTDTVAPNRLDTTGDPKFQSPWSYAGVPAVSIPCGLAAGMPCGLQLVGPPHGEVSLLSAAAWVERRLDFPHRPPEHPSIVSTTGYHP
jgi:aspartyl-tRNA(Asn)/glutamyl-tRNA(Gln) amidotransferase subunit A